MIPRRIILHCSDSGPVSAEEIKRWHLARGWRDIGYQMVIEVDGRVRKYPDIGRALNRQGAGVKGHNRGSLHICLVGRDKFYVAQFESLRYEIDGIRMTYRISVNEIYCHYEFNHKKTCPNMRIVDIVCWYAMFERQAIKKYLMKES